MEIQYYGSNCIRITTKKANIIINNELDKNEKQLIRNGDIALFTENSDPRIENEAKLTINQPGEYEVLDISVLGIPARGYNEEVKSFTNTIFKIENEELKLAVIGNIYPELTDSQLELLGEVDVLVIPVGNNDFTLSGSNALNIIKNIEPYIVIPTHYTDQKSNYDHPQATIEEALKELAMEVSETVPKLKLKSTDFIEGDTIKLVIVENSATN